MFVFYKLQNSLFQYYPAHDELGELMERLRLYGLFRSEHSDFKEEMDRIRRLKGKDKKHKWSTYKGDEANFLEEEEEEEEASMAGEEGKKE